MSQLTNSKLFPLAGSIGLGEMVALGQISGARMWYKAGYNASITGANLETVWTPGGAYAYPATGYPAGMEVVSSSTDDDGSPAGTGVQTVRIDYLTSAGVEKTETVTLDGTTAVATDADDIWRVLDFRAIAVGTGGVAAGTIDLREIDNAPIFSQIATGATGDKTFVYTVPADYKLVIEAVAVSSAGAAGTSFLRYMLRGNYDDYLGAASTTTTYTLMDIAIQNTGLVYSMPTPLVLPAGVDVRMDVIGDAATSAAIANCSARGFLIPV